MYALYDIWKIIPKNWVAVICNKIACIFDKSMGNQPIPATKMVEHFMLLYNSHTAETLYSYSKNTILRSHKQSISQSSFVDKCSPKLTEFINRLNQNAARYELR